MSQSTDEAEKMSTEVWIDHSIRLYAYPLVLLIGLTGNTISIAILTRPAMRSLPAYTYLTVLSFTDNLVLLSHLLRLWIRSLTGYDVSLQHNWACKLKSVVGFSTTHYSGWLIVAMTVDRYIAVTRPLQASCQGDKKRKTFTIITLLFVVFLLINLHFLWTNHLVPAEHDEFSKSLALSSSEPPMDEGQPLRTPPSTTGEAPPPYHVLLLRRPPEGFNWSDPAETTPVDALDASALDATAYICNNFDEFKVFYDNFWPWIDSTLHCWAPFIILSVLNFIIATKVVESKRMRSTLTNNMSLMASSFSESSRNFDIPCEHFAANEARSRLGEGTLAARISFGSYSRRKEAVRTNLVLDHVGRNETDQKKSVVAKSGGLLRLEKSGPGECYLDGRPDRKGTRFVSRARGASKRSRIDGDLRLAVMLLVVSFTFLATTLPVNVFMIAKALFVYEAELSIEMEDWLVMWQTVCDLLMYSNHAINFFLYCATGAKFRRQLFLAVSKVAR